ncbi:MAG TPA: glycosyltransferase [Burkholderiales bacterium]|nr:glycosyltransferase [Burkholderiales bacterium]
MPKVSVIIPSFNHEKFIAEAINSVLNQTFQDFEIIITDDASTDNTVDEIKKIKDSRIKLFINEVNQGAVITTNNCIKLSKSEYIALINSDDIWQNNKLEEQINFIESNPNYSVVFSQAYIIDENNNEITDDNSCYRDVFNKKNRSRFEWLNYFFYNGNCLCHPSILIKKSIYDELGLYNELIANLPDFDMWIRICLKYEIYIIPKKLVGFRVLDDFKNASSSTIGNTVRVQFENKQLLNHFLSIESVDCFKNIFSSYSYYGSVDNKEDILFILSRIAIDSKNNFMQLWGLELLYTVMVNKEKYEYIKKKFSFEYKDFFQLTKQKDVFNLYNVGSNFLQLFLIEGSNSDFSESLSIRKPINIDANEYEFDLKDYSSIMKLRIDPLETPCKIFNLKVFCIMEDNTTIKLQAESINGEKIKVENSYIFFTNDPQFIYDLKNISRKIVKVIVRYNFEILSVNEVVNRILDLECKISERDNKNKDLENSILDLEYKIRERDNKNEELNNLITKIHNTFTWKIIKLLTSFRKLWS